MINASVQARLDQATNWPRYRFYGVTVASDFPFANRMPLTSDKPQLTFTWVDEEPRRSGWNRREPIFVHPVKGHTGEPFLVVYEADDGYVLHYSQVAAFHLWHDRMVCHVLDRAHDYLVEIRLLGPVIALWLELRGVLALHASAVVVDGEAVAFASTNGGGKTSVAAILTQAGFSVLTDDLLAVCRQGDEFIGAAGHPQMRMWPEEAQLFTGRADELEIVHPLYTKRRVPLGEGGLGTFTERPVPLRCLYILERDQSRPPASLTVRAISPSEAMAELLRHSFVCKLVDALKLQRRRLPVLASLIAEVPIRHLVHATPREELPRLREFLLADLAELDRLTPALRARAH